jgi:hypothetical protein
MFRTRRRSPLVAMLLACLISSSVALAPAATATASAGNPRLGVRWFINHQYGLANVQERAYRAAHQWRLAALMHKIAAEPQTERYGSWSPDVGTEARVSTFAMSTRPSRARCRCSPPTTSTTAPARARRLAERARGVSRLDQLLRPSRRRPSVRRLPRAGCPDHDRLPQPRRVADPAIGAGLRVLGPGLAPADLHLHGRRRRRRRSLAGPDGPTAPTRRGRSHPRLLPQLDPLRLDEQGAPLR